MKKTLKNFLLLFALVFGAVAVSSCSKDSENDGNAKETFGVLSVGGMNAEIKYCNWMFINSWISDNDEWIGYYELRFMSYDWENGEEPTENDADIILSFCTVLDGKSNLNELPTGEFMDTENLPGGGSGHISSSGESVGFGFSPGNDGCGKLVIKKSGDSHIISVNPMVGSCNINDGADEKFTTSFQYKGVLPKLDHFPERPEEQ